MQKSKTINSNSYDYKTRSSIKFISFDENGKLMPVITHVTDKKIPYTVQIEGKYVITILYEEYKKPKYSYYIDNMENKKFMNEKVWQEIKLNNPWILQWMEDRYQMLLPVQKNETLRHKSKESKIEKCNLIKQKFKDFNPELNANVYIVDVYNKEFENNENNELYKVEYIKEQDGYILKKILFIPNGEVKKITYIFGKQRKLYE